MAKSIKWTEDDEAKLIGYVSEGGEITKESKRDGIARFAEETGRTEESVRRKLKALLEDESPLDGEVKKWPEPLLSIDIRNIDEKDFENVTEPDWDEEDTCEERVGVLKRIWRWITFQC